MTLREKIIIGAAGAAVLWGAVQILRSTVGGGKQAEERSAQDVQGTVVRVRADIAAARLTEAERLVLSIAQEEWDEHPFAEAGPVRAGRAPASDYVYSGYVDAGGRRFAVLNGREYRVGEALASGGGVIERIEPDHLVLLLGKGERRQVVPFQGAVQQDPAETRERK